MSLTPLPRRMSAVYFSEGEEAFENDDKRDACPYAFDSSEAPYWIAGWDAAADAAEEENRSTQEDQRLDDPRSA